MLYALLAALLFGAGIPISKALGATWNEVPLAGTLYFASGVVLLLARLALRTGEPLRRPHLPWLAGAVVLGGAVAPVALLYGLRFTTGYAGALLINLEAVFTAAIAVMLFRERLRPIEWPALAILVTGAVIVGWATAQDKEAPRPLLGGLLITLACLCWSLDNNFTRRIAQCDPLQIGGVKGVVAGAANLLVGAALAQYPPFEPQPLAAAALVGTFSYGASLALFVLALRRLGSARTGAIFSTATLAAGVLAAWLVLGERPPWHALTGGAVIAAGILWLALTPAAPTTAPPRTESTSRPA